MNSDPAAQTTDEWLAEYETAEQLQPVVAELPSLPKPRLIRSPEPEWISSHPPAEHLAPESFALSGQEPVKTWTYADAEGVPIGYVCRYEKGGKKRVMQWTWGRLSNETEEHWALKHFAKPRPLYNLKEALDRSDAQLVIVEGEKSADAARGSMPTQVAITWPGGAQAPQHADWTPLADRERKVAFLWPDNDDAGRSAMAEVGSRLFMLGYELWQVTVPDVPTGWDVADAVAEGRFVPDILRRHCDKWVPVAAEEILPGEAPAGPVAASEVEEAAETLPALPEPPAHVTEPPAPETPDQSGRWRVDHWQALGLELAGGKPIDNASNIALILEQEYQGKIWYDEFLNKVLTSKSDGSDTREWVDADDINLLVDIQRRCGLVKARKGTVQDAVVLHALKDLRNEVRDWLTGLEWDGKARIERFFTDYCAAGKSAYLTAVSRNFFVSLVARAMRPGCQVDSMVVLEGEQGTFKSSLCRALGGKWHTTMRAAPTSKDFEITLQGKWLIEIAELDAFSRAEVGATKRSITTATDRYRSPYARHAADHPRASVFIGTVNRSDYLTDETGARRFFPVACGAIDIESIRRDRDQLFAEALALFRAGASWHEVPEAEAKAIQRERYNDDVWLNAVHRFLEGRATATTSGVLEDIGVELAKQTTSDARRVSAILRDAGWTQKYSKDPSGKTYRHWLNPRAAEHAPRWAPRSGPSEDEPPLVDPD